MKQIISYLLAVMLLLVACEKKQTINIAGSTTVLPVVSIAAEQFKLNNKAINIIVSAGGSGVGVNQLGEGKIQLGMVSRDITSSEVDNFGQVKFNTMAIGRDAVIPAISSEIYDSGITALTIAQIASIYKGEVDNWSAFGGPNAPILCVDKEMSRGTRHIFMEVILGDKEALAPGADIVVGSNNEEQTALTQSTSAIGMVSNAWLNKDVKGLSIILENGDVIHPTTENIADGTYPITRDLCIISNGEPTGDLKMFVDFLFSKAGQAIVTNQGYIAVR